MLWMEIQEGRDRMRQKQYQSLGGCAACVMRGVTATGDIPQLNAPIEESDNDSILDGLDLPQPSQKKLFLGDSWFGSVKAAANIAIAGHHACFMVKTAHARSPKKFLDEKMKDMPGGTWITLEGHAEKEAVDLICIGYKYNKRVVMTFVLTKGAGATTKGKPYEARVPDKFGNVCVRLVARPDIISNYFKYCNVVDLHNQARQHDLALEKKWVTQNGYFRLYTTILGMNVVDTWKLCQDKNKLSISQFADELAADLLHQAEMLQQETTDQEVPLPIVSADSVITEVSSISPVSPYPSGGTHTKIMLEKGKQLRCIWCSRINLVNKKTTLMCKECGKGFCRDESGNGCWSHHVSLGGCPQAPKRGTLKRSVNKRDEITICTQEEVA